MRFGVGEYTLITGLNFTEPLVKNDLNDHSAIKRICELYLNDSTLVNCRTLGDFFYEMQGQGRNLKA